MTLAPRTYCSCQGRPAMHRKISPPVVINTSHKRVSQLSTPSTSISTHRKSLVPASRIPLFLYNTRHEHKSQVYWPFPLFSKKIPTSNQFSKSQHHSIFKNLNIKTIFHWRYSQYNPLWSIHPLWTSASHNHAHHHECMQSNLNHTSPHHSQNVSTFQFKPHSTSKYLAWDSHSPGLQ